MQRLSDLSKNLIAEKQANQEFKFTTDKGCLTPEQRRFYEENGYIVIKGFLKDEDIQKWKQQFLDYCDKKLPPYFF